MKKYDLLIKGGYLVDSASRHEHEHGSKAINRHFQPRQESMEERIQSRRDANIRKAEEKQRKVLRSKMSSAKTRAEQPMCLNDLYKKKQKAKGCNIANGLGAKKIKELIDCGFGSARELIDCWATNRQDPTGHEEQLQVGPQSQGSETGVGSIFS